MLLSAMNSNACIFDLDGVVFVNPFFENIEDFYKNIQYCIPQDWTVKLINGLYNQGIKIIFLTARDIKCRGITYYQLKELFDFPIHLYMRRRGDTREDYIVKQEYMEQLVKKYNILFCMDDNVKNCEMYRTFGLTTLQVK